MMQQNEIVNRDVRRVVRCSACFQPGHNRRNRRLCTVWRERHIERMRLNETAPVAVHIQVQPQPRVQEPRVQEPRVQEPRVQEPVVQQRRIHRPLSQRLRAQQPQPYVINLSREPQVQLTVTPRVSADFASARIETLIAAALSNINPNNALAEEANNLIQGAVNIFSTEITNRTGNNEYTSRSMRQLVEVITTLTNRIMMAEAHLITRAQSTLTKTYIKNIKIVKTLGEQEVDRTCTICMDELEFKNIINTNCNHTYCLECVSGYANSIKHKTCQPTCPMCRGRLEQFNTHSDEVEVGLIHLINTL